MWPTLFRVDAMRLAVKVLKVASWTLLIKARPHSGKVHDVFVGERGDRRTCRIELRSTIGMKNVQSDRKKLHYFSGKILIRVRVGGHEALVGGVCLQRGPKHEA